MRGIPLIRLAIVAILFLLVLPPLWKLTAAKPAAATVEPSPAAAPANRPTEIEIMASQPLDHFTVLHLGHAIWEGSGAQAATTLPLPAGMFDLQVQAGWPDAPGEKAMRIRLLRDEMPLAESTFWGNREVDEVLTIPAN